jgi:hypothetical protein
MGEVILEHVRYQVATQELIYDTIEDEVILLDIRTGTYFQLTGNAVPAWNWLVNGMSPDEIVDRFAQIYPNEQAAIEAGLTKFIRDLTAESLLAPRPADAAPRLDAPTPVPDNAGAPFAAPTVLKYTDMQSLLLLDPIHDVEAPGWPIQKAENSA